MTESAEMNPIKGKARRFGVGECPVCKRRGPLLTSPEGPRCRVCHPNAEAA